ncbi:MAG: AlpA family phage regulatory protein [Alphaproteobacteria bacterium]|nr:AlpA family phage regulatory protein [Alphaproteobacteria bacterium]
MPTNSPVVGCLLTAREVCAKLRISRTSLWRLQRSPLGFPAPISVGAHSVRWSEQAIVSWISNEGERTK